MEKPAIRFIVETSDTQVARRPRDVDGVFEVYVTKRHRDVFMHLARRIIDNGEHPSYAEVADALEWGYPALRQACLALARIGLLETAVRRARSIAVTPQGRTVYADWKAKKQRVVDQRRRYDAKKKAAKR